MPYLGCLFQENSEESGFFRNHQPVPHHGAFQAGRRRGRTPAEQTLFESSLLPFDYPKGFQPFNRAHQIQLLAQHKINVFVDHPALLSNITFFALA